MKEAAEDDLLPEFYAMYRTIPKYESSKVVKMSDVKDYIASVENGYAVIKYRDSKGNC